MPIDLFTIVCALFSPVVDASSVEIPLPAEEFITPDYKEICVSHFYLVATLPDITVVPSKEICVSANRKKTTSFCHSDAVVESVNFSVQPSFVRIRSPTRFFMPRSSRNLKMTDLKTKTSVWIRAPAFESKLDR